MSDAVVIEQLGHQYGTTQVLAGVDLAVRAGELVAVLGASGCGKTTLLRSIAGLVTPSSGSVTVGGQVAVKGGVEHLPIEKRRIGLVFQDYALFGSMTVAENVAYGIGSDPARVTDLLERVGLTGLDGRYPSELSGGQQQRVALARSLAPRPALLLLDEPFANVDADRRAELGAALRAALAAEQRAALLVTHDRTDALSLADRVLVLVVTPSGGVVGQLGTPEEVYRTPASAEVARLTGPGVVVEAHQLGLDGPGRVVLRPENVRIAASGLAGTVLACAFLGDGYRLHVQTSGCVLEVRSPARVQLGQALHVELHEPYRLRDSQGR